MQLVRTTSANPDFLTLVAQLDQNLKEYNGPDHTFYAQFNKVDKLNHCVVAYYEQGPVGCGAFKRYASNIVEIKRMFVHPAHRGQGVAGVVLTELEKWAAELGYTTGVLETGVGLLSAIGLYQRHGYARIANYGQYAGIESSVCMQKEISLG